MLPSTFDTLDTADATAVHEAAIDDLAAIIRGSGIESMADETGIGRERLETVRAGEDPALSVAEAAAIIAAAADVTQDSVQAAIQDRLLMGMTTAVLDVDTLAASADLGLSGTEVHQKIEGRAPLTLEEFAHLAAVIADRR